MLPHAAFSALKLGRIFPAAQLEAYPFYVEADPDGDFDTGYLGGQWDEELIDGVQLFFPAAAGTQLGVVELWAAGCVVGAAVRDRMGARSAALVLPWAANADRVLDALDLPFRMGSREKDVTRLAAGKVLASDYPTEWYAMAEGVEPGTVRSVHFACRAPDLYHMSGVVHATAGLLSFKVIRPDLVRMNDHDHAYDLCFGGLYDGG